MGKINRAYADKYRQLGRNLAYYRRLRGYSQAELAEKLDLSEGYVGHIEAQNVDKEPSLQVLFRIAEALDVPPINFSWTPKCRRCCGGTGKDEKAIPDPPGPGNFLPCRGICRPSFTK